MIQIEGLTKNFGQFCAVKEISFKISKGEVVGLLGPNGAGKTTTMRMLAGYYTPSQGNVMIDKMLIQSNKQEVQKIIGYLPESSSAYNDMLVCNYLDFVAEARGLVKEEKEEGIEMAVASTSLEDYYYRPISQLSKGYKQRVGLASTLVHSPQILILDEPTSGLDPNQIREMQNLICELSKEKTIILSTHILSEVEATCQRAIIINNGEIVLDKPLNELEEIKEGLVNYKVTIKGKSPEIHKEYSSVFQSEGEKVELLEDKENTKLLITSNKDAAEQIFKTAKKNNHVLIDLYLAKSSLEDIFSNLTESEKEVK